MNDLIPEHCPEGWTWIEAKEQSLPSLWEDVRSTPGDVILAFEELESTQTFARDIPTDLIADRTVVVLAIRQDAGYGRLGRTWFSDPMACLTLTWISSIQVDIPFGWLPLSTALAISETLALWLDEDIHLDVKWPNDILINEQKVAGILMENKHLSPKPIIYTGVGINIGKIKFPEELQSIATSLSHHCPLAGPSRADVLTKFLDFYAATLGVLQQGGIEQLRQAYQERSTYVDGKAIAFQLKGERIEAISCGLNDDGELCCRDRDGRYHELNISEIETLRKQ